MSFPIKLQYCPNCGGRCDTATDPAHPDRTQMGSQGGELGVCIHCLAALEIHEDGTLHPANLNQFPILELLKVLSYQRQIIERRRRQRHVNN